LCNQLAFEIERHIGAKTVRGDVPNLSNCLEFLKL
jgi:hypothetical protein